MPWPDDVRTPAFSRHPATLGPLDDVARSAQTRHDDRLHAPNAAAALRAAAPHEVAFPPTASLIHAYILVLRRLPGGGFDMAQGSRS